MSPNFKIRYLTGGRIVRIHFIGRVGLAERLQVAGQVVGRYRHLNPLRLLVDTRYAETTMSTAEQRRFAEFIRQHPVLRRARIAVLFRSGDSPVALTASRIAQRAGNTRQFLVESEALAWLRSRKQGR
ncbi:hypothetical protein [Microbulbifer taiwanensis]|uniref:STAS/SEC14 domain-containing protein n=1 Tax=Microbulbifer taiwanensis TaxID=986746 RepID=A0ABW1YQM3_9GAMM|nr:hypothetical protein [Microbulbifer taiwanensis]